MDRMKLVQGDITELVVDAIVNAANNELKLGSGVAGAIRRQGGPSIQEECDRIGSIEIGGAAITSGGNLKAKWVIHAASMGFGIATTAESLRNSTRASLEIARKRKMGTVAFPALGTGVAGFPLKECAEIMMGEVKRFLEENEYPREVVFCLFGEGVYNVFQKVIKSWTNYDA